MFKSDWEKTSVTHQLPKNVIEKMVQLAYPDKNLIFHKLIVGGSLKKIRCPKPP